MSRLSGPELAAVLVRKGEGDAKAMHRLASDPQIDDDAVGFHAQQATEKFLKATLARSGATPPRTHDLGRLLELLAEQGIAPPPGADWLDELTDYAVPMRYEDLLDAEPLDRERVGGLVDQIAAWSAGLS